MENAYNTTRPLVHGVRSENQLVHKNSGDSSGLSQGTIEPVSAWDHEDEHKTICGMRRRNFWILLAVTGALVVAIGVGAGLGVSISQRAKASNASSQALNPIITADATSQTDAPTSTTSVTSADDALPTEILPPTFAVPITTVVSSPPPGPTNFCNGEISVCDRSDCAGVNDANGGNGKCTSSPYEGCDCLSVCGEVMGLCIQDGCGGVDGFCTAGAFNGCRCAT